MLRLISKYIYSILTISCVELHNKIIAVMVGTHINNHAKRIQLAGSDMQMQENNIYSIETKHIHHSKGNIKNLHSYLKQLPRPESYFWKILIFWLHMPYFPFFISTTYVSIL